jgi:Zn-dependent M28 family amino/carboxypeptidase
VWALSQDIGERNLDRPEALEHAARYVERTLREAGYGPVPQPYQVAGQTVRNIEAVLPGETPESVLVGAHYDTAWGTPGANDNATGVAALLEIARNLAGRRFPRTVRFVAFVNEEPPYFQTPAMGSRVYAQRARERREPIAAMFSLETIGYYADEPGSQRYPFPLQFFYPDKGNFLAFVGNLASRALVAEAAAHFRRATDFPVERAVLPAWFPAVDLSDHGSFWEQGFPAVLVTDTAMFRYPWYHSPGDTPDRLHFSRLAAVVSGLTAVVAGIAGGDPDQVP